MDWLIKLRGNSIVLDNLDQSMSSPHFIIFDDSDDHQSEQFFLRSSHFNGNESGQAVFSAASGLVQLINGASAIHWGFNNYIRRGSISIDGIYSTNKQAPRDYDWSNVSISKQVAPSNPFIGIESRSRNGNPYRSATTGYIQLCLDNDDVFHLLRQISVGFDWRNLYCIWDTVAHYCGGSKQIIKHLDLNENEIKAFTGTANSFGVLGLEARHGVMGWGVPQNTVTKEEAVDIINNVVKKYLNKKFCFNCKYKEWEKNLTTIQGDSHKAAAL